MRRPLAGGLRVAAPLAAVLAMTGAVPASAHEERPTGDVRVVVGWGDEPAYTGFKNSVQVTVSEAEGRPVTDAGDSLKVEVIKGSDRVTLPMVANFRAGGSGALGDYRAWLTPTRPGDYTFRLTGTIGGQTVDESFTSSATTFNPVEDVSAIQFPAKDPTTGQLATRIEREIPRAVEAGRNRADERVDGARRLAMIGVLVGGLGLVTAVGALAAVRRRSGRPGEPRSRPDDAPSEQAGSLRR